MRTVLLWVLQKHSASLAKLETPNKIMETEGYWRNEYKKLELQLRETYAQVNYYVNENTKLREENVKLREQLNEQSV